MYKSLVWKKAGKSWYPDLYEIFVVSDEATISMKKKWYRLVLKKKKKKELKPPFTFPKVAFIDECWNSNLLMINNI